MRAFSALLLLPALACASARPSATSRVLVAATERDVLALERAWGDAEARRDGRWRALAVHMAPVPVP